MRSGRGDLDEPLEPGHLLQVDQQQHCEQVENARVDGPQTSLLPSLKDRVLLSSPLLSSFYFLGSFIALMGLDAEALVWLGLVAFHRILSCVFLRHAR